MSSAIAPLDLPMLMASAGVYPTLQVLYVPDYVPAGARSLATRRVAKKLEESFPDYRIALAVSEGPFEDSEGTSSHFDGDILKLQKQKMIAKIRTDFQVSIAKLCRNACYHSPKLIIGEGQGALICYDFAKPFVMELSLQTRNVQKQEAQQMGEAWGNVSAIVGINPRLFKKGIMLNDLQLAMPELFKDKCPVPSIRHFQLQDYKSSVYLEEKELVEKLSLEEIDGINKAVLSVLVKQPGRIMWDNDGVCSCGKHTYLFCQCFRCLQGEMREDERKLAEEELDEEIYKAPEEDSSVAQASGLPPWVSAAVTHGSKKSLQNSHSSQSDSKVDSQCRTIFITDMAIHCASRSKGESWKPVPHCYCIVTPWKHGSTFEMHRGKVVGPDNIVRPEFRISFVVDVDDIMLLQPRVCVLLEKSHKVSTGAWSREPNDILQNQYGVVSTLLESQMELSKQRPPMKSNSPWWFRREERIAGF